MNLVTKYKRDVQNNVDDILGQMGSKLDPQARVNVRNAQQNEGSEMKDTYSKSKYTPTPREKELEGVFGQYGEDVPPPVLRYLRKNPGTLIKRLYGIYGEKLHDYISDHANKEEINVEDVSPLSAQAHEDAIQGEEEMDEQTSSGSAGAYAPPMGWEPKKQGSTVQNKSLNEEEEMDEQTGSGSAGSYSQPQIWAKNYKNWKAVQDPKFPKWGGPGGTYVRVKKKCSHFPYCNQGDINALEFYEEKTLKEAIENVSKKTNKSIPYLKNIILNELESKFATDLRKFKDYKIGSNPPHYTKKKSKKKKKRSDEEEIDEIIRRAFYKSPVTDPDAGIVGVAPMNRPIGKIFSMKGNKPKYE